MAPAQRRRRGVAQLVADVDVVVVDFDVARQGVELASDLAEEFRISGGGGGGGGGRRRRRLRRRSDADAAAGRFGAALRTVVAALQFVFLQVAI